MKKAIATLLFAALAVGVNAKEICLREESTSPNGATPNKEINKLNIYNVFSGVTLHEYSEQKDVGDSGIVTGDWITYVHTRRDPIDRDRWSRGDITYYRDNTARTEEIVCVDTIDVLELGANDVDVNTDGHTIAYVDQAFSFRVDLEYAPGRDVNICNRQGTYSRGLSYNPTRIFCDEEFDPVYEDLSPEIHRMVNEAKAHLELLIEEALDVENEYERQVVAVEAAIENIEGKRFANLEDSDLVDVQEALDLYYDLRRTLVELEAQNELLSERLVNSWSEASKRIDSSLEEQGVDVQHFEEIPVLDVSTLEPVVGDSAVPVDNVQYYQAFSEHTIQRLRYLADSGQNREFTFQARSWLNQAASMQKQLEDQLIATPEEWQALTTSFDDVESYVFSIVDHDLWFKDTPVTRAQRQSLSSIKEHSPVYGSLIEQELRAWRESHMTDERRHLLTAMHALGSGIEEAGDDSTYDQLLLGLATSIREGSVCAAKVLVTADFGDFYEVVIGKDLCSGDELSTGERLVSALGFAVGNARFWRGVARASGLLADARYVVNLTADLKAKATTLGMSDEQIDGLARKMNELFPCQ